MNRFILKAGILIAIDSDDNDIEMICENFYARLSELVQSEKHMLEASIEGFALPGNEPVAEEEVTA
jgi:hypothetical protein